MSKAVCLTTLSVVEEEIGRARAVERACSRKGGIRIEHAIGLTMFLLSN